jgi:large subunit ribosomal protein L5
VRRRAVSKEAKAQEEKPVEQAQDQAEKPAKAQAAEAPAGEKAKAPKEQAKGEKKAPKDQKEGKKGGKSGAEAAPAEKKKAPKDPPGYIPRLKKLFREGVAKDLREEFSYKSAMQIPKLSKIIVSMGLGEGITNKKIIESAVAEMSQITGRRAVKTKAKKSIAQFKIRKGMEIGAMVTLRGNTMYEFLDRLINVAMPRIKDFRGSNPNAFDGHGNYSLGVTEQIIFPEIDYDKIERISGMNVAIVTTARTDAEARSLLARLGMPFRK